MRMHFALPSIHHLGHFVFSIIILYYNFAQKSEQNSFSIPKKPGFIINHLDKAIKNVYNITENQHSDKIILTEKHQLFSVLSQHYKHRELHTGVVKQ